MIKDIENSQSHHGDQKLFWNNVNRLLGRSKSNDTDKVTANEWKEYFSSLGILHNPNGSKDKSEIKNFLQNLNSHEHMNVSATA